MKRLKKEKLLKRINGEYEFLVLQVRVGSSPECMLILNSKKNAEYLKQYIDEKFEEDLTCEDIKVEDYYLE